MENNRKLEPIDNTFLKPYFKKFVAIQVPHFHNTGVFYEFGYLEEIGERWVVLKTEQGNIKSILIATILGIQTSKPKEVQ